MQKLGLLWSIFFTAFFTFSAAAEVTISHGYSPFGELKYPADFEHFDYVNPNAPKGGKMVMRARYGVDTFDSLNTIALKGNPAWEVSDYVYETLLVRSQDEPDSVYGLLASSIEYPEDLSYVTFELRPEARFSDGTPVTADDVKFTFDSLKADGPPWYANTLTSILNVTAETPHRVRFDLEDGVGITFPLEFSRIEILPRHFFDDVKIDDSWTKRPIGSGPYVVETFDPPLNIRFCRNPDYWGAHLPVNQGKDNFECWEHQYYADDNVMREAFKAGEFLFLEEYKAAAWETAFDYRATNEGWVKKLQIPEYRVPTFQAIWLNTRRPHLHDIRVRKAIAIAFNFKWSNETLYYNAYTRGDSIFAQTDMEAKGPPQGLELELLEPFRNDLPVEVFSEAAWRAPEGTSRPRDRESLSQASALLDDAGWRVGDDGKRRNAEGEILKLDFPDDSSSKRRLYLPYSEILTSLGIEVDYRKVDPAQMEELETAFEYDMTSNAWGFRMTPGREMANFWGSEAANTVGSNNFPGISNDAIDAMIEHVSAAQSREELNAAARALDRLLRAGHYWVPLYYSSGFNVLYWDVFGRPEAAPPFDRGDRYWWWDEKAHQALIDAGALR